jgi:hypothetical protein
LKLINKEHDAAPAPTEVAIAAVASAGSSKNVEQPRATFAVPIAIPYDFNVSALKLHAAESHGEQEDYFWGV